MDKDVLILIGAVIAFLVLCVGLVIGMHILTGDAQSQYDAINALQIETKALWELTNDTFYIANSQPGTLQYASTINKTVDSKPYSIVTYKFNLTNESVMDAVIVMEYQPFNAANSTYGLMPKSITYVKE